MPEWRIVEEKILTMFLVIFGGWISQRIGLFTKDVLSCLGRFVVTIAFPALVFVQMINTISVDIIGAGLGAPFIFAILMILGGVASWLLSYLFTQDNRRSFLFLAGLPNWVFLPLPIAEALYGQQGVRLVLLCNLGAQAILWTVGVAVLQGWQEIRKSWKGIVCNSGIVATLSGIAIAIVFPNLRQDLTAIHSPLKTQELLLVPLFKALEVIGGLTIPLSLIVTGAQLGLLSIRDHRPSLPDVGISIIRLCIVPLCVMAGIAIWNRFSGVILPRQTGMILCLIMAMPVAVSSTVFLERYGGDSVLGARSIFISSLASLVTVPLITMLYPFVVR